MRAFEELNPLKLLLCFADMDSDTPINSVQSGILVAVNADAALPATQLKTDDRVEGGNTPTIDTQFRPPSVASGVCASLVTVADALVPLTMFRTLVRSTLTTNQQMVCACTLPIAWSLLPFPSFSPATPYFLLFNEHFPFVLLSFISFKSLLAILFWRCGQRYNNIDS